ncbi:major facilitator superfamily domain-containing protein [Aspergillus nidulans var. acristatus]
MESCQSVRSMGQGTVDACNQLVWQLLFSCEFGFLFDQMLLISITIIMPNTAKELNPQYQILLSASLYAGLFVGAIACGLLTDILGRKTVWQLSIFRVSIATLLAASSPNWKAVNVWTALWGLFGGGNLAIDLTVLTESLPKKWSFLLTGLACIWGLGNAITALISWPLVVNFCCPNGTNAETCTRSNNMGWRYIDIVLGSLCLIMSIARSFALGMHESPRWLVAQGRTEDAVAALNKISFKNRAEYVADPSQFCCLPDERISKRTWLEEISSIKELFRGRLNLRILSCLFLLWVFIGICYPLFSFFLPYYLASHGANLGDGSNYQTYRDLVLSSVVGIFGPLLSAYLVRVRKLGDRGTLFLTSCTCAVFADLFTQVRTETQNIAFSCIINFWLNALYAAIYSYTPSSLETKHRGVGCGLLMACGRLVSIFAPFIATFGDVTLGVQFWVSCAMYVCMGLLELALPQLG